MTIPYSDERKVTLDGLPAIIPPNEPEFNMMANMSDSLGINGLTINTIELKDVKKDSELIIISKENEKFSVVTTRLKISEIQKGGILLKIKTDKDENQKKILAEFIVSMNKKQIEKSAAKMVYDALMRKPISTLKKLRVQTKKKKKSKLETRRGCVFLQIGNEAVNL